MLRILGRLSSINVRKVVWTCREAGIDFVREDWGQGFRSPAEPEFQALSRKALVPVVIDGPHVLTESNAICRYLAAKAGRGDLYPGDLVARAAVEAWMDWQSADLNGAWRYAVFGLVRQRAAFQDPAMIAASLAEWQQRMQVIEAALGDGRPHIGGEAFTLADILLGLSINRWARMPCAMPEMPASLAYAARLAARPAAAGLMGAGTD
jgi:glutathione S-transferase